MRRAGAAICASASMLRSMVGTAARTVPPSASVLATRRGRELGNQHQTGAAAHRQQAHPDAEDEGEAQRHDDRVLRGEAQEPVEHGKLAGQTLVTDDHALRLARAAGGEDDQSGVAQARPAPAGEPSERLSIRPRSTRKRAPVACWAASAANAAASARHRHRHATREPDPEQPSKVERRVGDGRQDRLSRRDGRQVEGDGPGLDEQLTRRDGRPLRRPRSAPWIAQAPPRGNAPRAPVTAPPSGSAHRARPAPP